MDPERLQSRLAPAPLRPRVQRLAIRRVSGSVLVGAVLLGVGAPATTAPLTLRAPARPQSFVEALGMQAGLWGSLEDRFEGWIYPFKAFDSFSVSVRAGPPALGSPDPAPPVELGISQAKLQVAMPHLARLEFAAADWKVDVTFFTPRDLPVLLVRFDVRAARGLELRAQLRPVLVPMHLEPKAPLVFAPTGETAPRLLAREPARQLELWADSLPPMAAAHGTNARLELRWNLPRSVPPRIVWLALALSSPGGPEAPRTAAAALSRADALMGEARGHYDDLLARAPRVRSPDPEVNAAMAWSVVSLDQLRVRHPDFGCALVSGYSSSGASTRPRYCWFFEEPTLTSWAYHRAGLSSHVREALAFLQQFQRADGKTVHEVSASLRYWPDYFRTFRYAYMHTDGPVYFLAAYGEYYRATGDREFIRREWPRIRRALDWCESVMDPADQLLRVEPGEWGSAESSLEVWKDTQLEGMWVRALRSVAALARAMGEPELAARCTRRAEDALAAIERSLWNEAATNYLWGVDRQGRPLRSLVPHHAVSFWLSELRPDRVARALERLAAADFRTDWGVRSLALSDPAYNAQAYQNGSVWPVWNSGVIVADYRHGRAADAFRNWRAMVRARTVAGLGPMPEVLGGHRFARLPEGVPHQMFSELAVQNGFYEGLLGLDVDVPARRLELAPRLPPAWKRLRIDRIPFGPGQVDVEVRRRPTRLDLSCSVHHGGGAAVRLAPALPAGSQVTRVEVDGRAIPYRVDSTPAETVVAVELPRFEGRRTLRIDHRGGVEFQPVDAELEPGGASVNLRLIRTALSANTWSVQVEGRPGRAYAIDLFTARIPGQPSGGTLQQLRRDRFRLTTSAPPGAPTNAAGYAAWGLAVDWTSR